MKLTTMNLGQSVAEQQQFYTHAAIVPEDKDREVKPLGKELGNLSVNKLNYIVTYIDKLIAQKFESIIDRGTETNMEHIRGYVEGLRDLKKLFESAIGNKA